MSPNVVIQARNPRGRVTDLTCHILNSTSQPGSNLQTNHARPPTVYWHDDTCATVLGGRPPIEEWISRSGIQPVIVAYAVHAPLAQLVEQLTLNQRVRGSKP